jgi:hypothetical protein
MPGIIAKPEPLVGRSVGCHAPASIRNVNTLASHAFRPCNAEALFQDGTGVYAALSRAQ